MIKEKLFDIEVEAKDILKDIQRELVYLDKNIEVSGYLANEEEMKAKEAEFNSAAYKDASELRFAYRTRLSVYREMKERLEAILDIYEEVNE